MYKTALVREVTDALKATFDDQYPDELLRNIYVGPEWQESRMRYPLIYVKFTESFTRNVGLGHYFEIWDDDSGENKRYGQWYFQGALTFNCMALNSHERDVLSDEILKVLAFGRFNPFMKRFHDEIYDNDWILMYLMTEETIPGAESNFPAPWANQDDQIYHTSHTVNMTGEFYSDPYSAEVVRISTIIPYPYRPDQQVPKGSQHPDDIGVPWIGEPDSKGR